MIIRGSGAPAYPTVVHRPAASVVPPQANGAYAHARESSGGYAHARESSVNHPQRHLYSYASSSLSAIEDYMVQLEDENSRLKGKMLSNIRPALVCLFASQDGQALSCVLGAWKRFWEERKYQQMEDYWEVRKRQSRLDYSQKIEELEERLTEQKSKSKAVQEQVVEASKYAQDLEAERDGMITKATSLKSHIAEADKCVKVLSQETESALDVVRNDFRKYERMAAEYHKEATDSAERPQAPGPRGELANIKDKLDRLVSRVAASPSAPSAAVGSTAQVSQPLRPSPPPPPPPPPGSERDTVSVQGGSLEAQSNGKLIYQQQRQPQQRQPSPLIPARSLQSFPHSYEGPPTAQRTYPLELQPAPGSMSVEGMVQVPPQQSPDQLYQGSLRLTPGPVPSIGSGPGSGMPSPMPYAGGGRQPYMEPRSIGPMVEQVGRQVPAAVPRLYLGS